MRLPPRLPAAVGLGTVFVALAVGGPWWPTAALAGLLLLALAGTAPTTGRSPFVRWQLVRAARRGRPFLSRVLIAGVGLLAAGVMTGTVRNLETRLGSDPLTATAFQAVELAGAVLAGLIGLLVLVYAGRAAFTLPGAIAEEREANRLDHLLVTDLRTGEILLGRTVGVAAPMAAEALVPLPLLVLLAAYSGAAPEALAMAAVLAGGLMIGTLGVAVGCTAGARTTARAVGRTLAVLMVLFVGTLLISVMATTPARFLPGLAAWEPQVGRVLDALAAGNPVLYLRSVYVATPATALTDSTARHYLAWHVAVLGIGWWAAARRLRPPAVRRPVPVVRPTVRVRRTHSYRLKWWAAPLTVAGVLTGVLLFAPRDFEWLLSTTFTLSGPLAFFCITVPAGWAAARRLPLERQLNTLDSLLLTALTPEQLVRRAWRQGLRTVAGPTAGLAALYGCLAGITMFDRLVAGPSSPPPPIVPLFAVGLVALSIAANTALVAALGVLVSVPAATPRKATAALLLVGLYWTVGWFGWWIASDSPAAPRAVHILVPGVAQTLFTTRLLVPDEILWNTVLSAFASAALLAAACVWFRRRVRPTPEVPA